MKSTCFSSVRCARSGWPDEKPASATLASMRVMAFLYGSASSARWSALWMRAVEIISIVRVICIVLRMELMRRCISRRLAMAYCP